MTAVEWLEDKLNGVDTGVSYHHFKKIIEQAKEMEKQQHNKTFVEGLYCESGDSEEFEKYYNETLKNTKE